MGRPKGSKNKPKDPLNQAKSVSLSENAKKNKEKAIKGSPTAICSKCHKEFQQEFKPEMNAYTSHKLCEDCRQRESYDKQRRAEENGETVFNALLNYTPFPAQQEMHKAFENHRFLVLNCVLPGQIVQGCNKKIEDVVPGDKVISLNGKEAVVEQTICRPYSGKVYEIKTGSTNTIIVTEDHPVYSAVAHQWRKDNHNNYDIIKEGFIKAKTLKKIFDKCDKWNNNYCMMKIPKVKGYISKPWLTCETAYELGSYFYTKEPSTIQTEELSDKYDYENIPQEVMFNEDDEIVKAFLRGYFQHDRINAYQNVAEIHVSSESKAYQIQQLWARLGVYAIVKPDGENTIVKLKDNKDNNALEIIGIQKENDGSWIHRISFAKKYTDDGIYVGITSIKEKNYKGMVYDLTTSCHTFTVNNLAIHNCGNRTGKDRFSNMAGIIYFVECLNENRHIDHPDIVPSVYWWIIAPTETMAMQNWRELKKFFPKDWVVSISNTTMTMQTIGGGMIEVRSAYDPESLVGVGLDLVTITEAARIKDLDVVWANLEARLSSPGRGREKDRRGKSYGVGKAIINSSPIGKNYFYTMWTWGQPQYDDYSSDWVSFSLPWTVNPANAEKAKEIIHTKYGDITYEESLRRRIGDRMYRQNYLADFLAGSGQVFADFQDKCCEDIYSAKFNFTELERLKYIQEWQSVKPYRRYRASWDIATGSSEDSPVLMIRDMEENKIVKLVDLYGKDYEAQYETISYWCKHYNNAECVFSSTGHTACVGQLLKRGVSEVVVNEGGGNKTTFVINAQCACQNGDIHFLMDGSVEAQRAYAQIVDYTEHQNGKYSNESEPHDDWASALYLNYYDYQVQEAKPVWIGTFGTVDRDLDYFW